MATYADLFNAIEKNGYEVAIAALVVIRENEVQSACAFGQGLLNLGVKPKKIHEYVGFSRYSNHYFSEVYRIIYQWNDDEKYPPAKIAEMSRVRFKGILDQPLPLLDEYLKEQ